MNDPWLSYGLLLTSMIALARLAIPPSNIGPVELLHTGSTHRAIAVRHAQHGSCACCRGGSFMLVPWQGQLAYVAMMPPRPVADAATDAMQSLDDTSTGAAALHWVLVMAIDDQEEARDAPKVPRANGVIVQHTSSVAEALARLSSTPRYRWPAVLLCDIVLGSEDGYEVLRSVRAPESELRIPPWSSQLPALALTGFTDSEDRRAGAGCGFPRAAWQVRADGDLDRRD